MILDELRRAGDVDRDEIGSHRAEHGAARHEADLGGLAPLSIVVVPLLMAEGRPNSATGFPSDGRRSAQFGQWATTYRPMIG